jgi:hypothetical protein
LDHLERRTAALYAAPKVEVEPNASPLDFLYAVFRNNDLPLITRMRAAEAAAPFVHPKLAAVISASISGDEFGEALERARKRVVERPKPSTSQGFASKALPRPGLPE